MSDEKYDDQAREWNDSRIFSGRQRDRENGT